jgi:hypothetical protein
VADRYDPIEESEREWLRISRRNAARRVWLLIGVIMAGVAAFLWFTGSIGQPNPQSPKRALSPPLPQPIGIFFYGGLALIGIALLSAIAGVITPVRTNEEIENQLRAALRETRETLLGAGIMPFLRTTLSTRMQSSYESELLVREAPGLSEVFDPVFEIPVAATSRLQRLFDTLPGGSIGVAGPRGAGKTTLIRSFCNGSRAPENSISTMLSAPVEYSPRDFVLHLFASLCQEVLGQAEEDSSTPSSLQHVREVGARVLSLPDVLLLCGLILITVGISLVATFVRDVHIDSRIAWGLGLFVCGVFVVVTARPRLPGRTRLSSVTPSRGELLRAVAARRLEEIRFQQTTSSGWSGAAKTPVGVEATLTGSATMARVQLSFPEIVSMLRRFLELLTLDTRVVIGIDELDKLPSDEKARQFLNEIKAIFGVRGCYYLVSISEEAMASFERRGLPFRDVFDSSFDEVVEVSYLRLDEAQGLLNRRVVFPAPFTCLCYCLSGGLARDLIRAARSVIEVMEAQPVEVLKESGEVRRDHAEQGGPEWIARPLRIGEAARLLVGEEVRQKTVATVAALRAIDLEPEVSAVIEWGIDLVDRRSALVDKLLKQCRWCIESNILRPGNEDEGEHAQSARATLYRLTAELACYYYHSATVLEFFEGAHDEDRLHEVLDSPEGRDLITKLATSRQALALNPHLAWKTVSSVRQSWNLAVIHFPEVLLKGRGSP